MNEDKNEQNQLNENVDPRNMQAEVIGELRNDKIGKPKLVIMMMLIFILVLVALPIYNKMKNDETSFIYKKLYGETTTAANNKKTTTTDEYKDATQLQVINSELTLRNNDLIITNVHISDNTLNYTLHSYNGVINLDESNLFFEVYNSSEKLVTTIKLTDSVDFSEKNYTYSKDGINYNDKYTYYIKLVDMTDQEYPKIEIPTDESGIGTLVCKKDDRTIEYTFLNNYLISIKDVFDYKNTNSDYLVTLQSYQKKANLLQQESTVTETEDGFEFVGNINLELEGYSLPEEINDYDYYAQDTKAEVISYNENGKGFDCE